MWSLVLQVHSQRYLGILPSTPSLFCFLNTSLLEAEIIGKKRKDVPENILIKFVLLIPIVFLEELLWEQCIRLKYLGLFHCELYTMTSKSTCSQLYKSQGRRGAGAIVRKVVREKENYDGVMRIMK